MCKYQSNICVVLSVLISAGEVASTEDNNKLKEADARDAAHNLISRTEDRFDCVIDEKSMSELNGDQFLVEIEAKGEGCDEAMTYLVNLSDRGAKLVIRQVGESDPGTDLPMYAPPQALIYKLNPALEDEGQEEMDDNRLDPEGS